ncbi:TPA: PIN domain-containing protein [Yersinia enterocolitica]|nr:PIN domain-containing protein [Yersinia enterocolitica]
MAFSGIILANIYDISVDTPQKEEFFLVDTNVWYWMTYTKGITPSRPYLSIYPKYLSNVIANDAVLLHSGLSLAELTHIIERTEREIHEKAINKKIKTKEFRHDYPNERNTALSEIETSWLQVENLAVNIDINICTAVTNRCIQSLKTNTLDGYDLMILDSMSQNNIKNIITDDSDYVTVKDINVFTANTNVIKCAAAQGKLITRN